MIRPVKSGHAHVPDPHSTMEKEAANLAAFARGQLGLDRYGLRDRLGEFGIQYVSFAEYQRKTR